MLDDGLADDADMPGLGDEDEGEDEDEGMSLNSLMFGGEDEDHMLPGGPDCVKKCSADCADDCKLDVDSKDQCMTDCHGECGELCKPLDDDLAGTDGDRLMDIAEKGVFRIRCVLVLTAIGSWILPRRVCACVDVSVGERERASERVHVSVADTGNCDLAYKKGMAGDDDDEIEDEDEVREGVRDDEGGGGGGRRGG